MPLTEEPIADTQIKALVKKRTVTDVEGDGIKQKGKQDEREN